MSNQIIDLRKYNIKDEDDALEFLGLIESKLPQLQKVIKGSRLKQASLINRAEHAEGKLSSTTPDVVDSPASVGDRITGRIPVSSAPSSAAARIQQMKEAQIVEAPAEPLPAADMVPSAEAVSPNPAPGEIGQLDAQPESKNGPVDLAAIANAQSNEEEVANEAGTSPSEHASDDGVQSQDQDGDLPSSAYEIKEDDVLFTQFVLDEDLYQHVLSDNGATNQYLKNAHHISVQDFNDAAAEEAERPKTQLSPDDTVGVGDRVAREQSKAPEA